MPPKAAADPKPWDRLSQPADSSIPPKMGKTILHHPDAWPQPELPVWRRTEYRNKLPLPGWYKAKLSTGPVCGGFTPKWKGELFDMWDLQGLLYNRDYHALNDEALWQFCEGHKDQLLQNDLITPDKQVRAGLREYNQWRKSLFRHQHQLAIKKQAIACRNELRDTIRGFIDGVTSGPESRSISAAHEIKAAQISNRDINPRYNDGGDAKNSKLLIELLRLHDLTKAVAREISIYNKHVKRMKLADKERHRRHHLQKKLVAKDLEVAERKLYRKVEVVEKEKKQHLEENFQRRLAYQRQAEKDRIERDRRLKLETGFEVEAWKNYYRQLHQRNEPIRPSGNQTDPKHRSQLVCDYEQRIGPYHTKAWKETAKMMSSEESSPKTQPHDFKRLRPLKSALSKPGGAHGESQERHIQFAPDAGSDPVIPTAKNSSDVLVDNVPSPRDILGKSISIPVATEQQDSIPMDVPLHAAPSMMSMPVVSSGPPKDQQQKYDSSTSIFGDESHVSPTDDACEFSSTLSSTDQDNEIMIPAESRTRSRTSQTEACELSSDLDNTIHNSVIHVESNIPESDATDDASEISSEVNSTVAPSTAHLLQSEGHASDPRNDSREYYSQLGNSTQMSTLPSTNPISEYQDLKYDRTQDSSYLPWNLSSNNQSTIPADGTIRDTSLLTDYVSELQSQVSRPLDDFSERTSQFDKIDHSNASHSTEYPSMPGFDKSVKSSATASLNNTSVLQNDVTRATDDGLRSFDSKIPSSVGFSLDNQSEDQKQGPFSTDDNVWSERGSTNGQGSTVASTAKFINNTQPTEDSQDFFDMNEKRRRSSIRDSSASKLKNDSPGSLPVDDSRGLLSDGKTLPGQNWLVASLTRSQHEVASLLADEIIDQALEDNDNAFPVEDSEPVIIDDNGNERNTEL